MAVNTEAMRHALRSELERLANRLSPRLRRRLLQTFAAMPPEKVGIILEALAQGRPESVVAAIMEQPRVASAWRTLRAEYAQGLLYNASQIMMRDIFRAHIKIDLSAPVFTPAFRSALERWENGAFENIRRDVREGLRELVVEAMQEERASPASAARRIQQQLKSAGGLTAYDRGLVSSYRDALIRRDRAGIRRALDRRLRDKRSDAKVRTGRYSAKDIDRLVANYEKKLVRLRADTFARTSAMDNAAAANDAAWQEAVDSGAVPLAEVRRYWVVSPTEALCKFCAPIPGMNPLGRALNEDFDTPLGPRLRPTLHPRCQCSVFIRRERAGVRRAPQPGLIQALAPSR